MNRWLIIVLFIYSFLPDFILFIVFVQLSYKIERSEIVGTYSSQCLWRISNWHNKWCIQFYKMRLFWSHNDIMTNQTPMEEDTRRYTKFKKIKEWEMNSNSLRLLIVIE